MCVHILALPADVWGDFISCDGNHVGRHGLISGQPVGIIITRSIAAGTVCVTEQEGHGGETHETASHCAWEFRKKTLEKCFIVTRVKSQITVINKILIISGYDGSYVHTKVLAMSSLISIDKEEGVTRVDETGAIRAVRVLNALTVSGNQETICVICSSSPRQTSQSF